MSDFNMNTIVDAINARLSSEKMSANSIARFTKFRDSLSNEKIAEFIIKSELNASLFSKNVHSILRLNQTIQYALLAIRDKQCEYIDVMLASAIAAQKANIKITRADLKSVCSAHYKIKNAEFASVARQSSLTKIDETINVQESITFFVLQALNVLVETNNAISVNMKSHACKALLKRINA